MGQHAMSRVASECQAAISIVPVDGRPLLSGIKGDDRVVLDGEDRSTKGLAEVGCFGLPEADSFRRVR